jgi:hypothetical protein
LSLPMGPFVEANTQRLVVQKICLALECRCSE